jgi:SynChlorMet cassette protein ScmC
MTGSTYCFELADGQEWDVTSDSAARPWADRFAKVMRLKSGAPAGGKKLIFTIRDPDGQKNNEAVYGDFRIIRILHYNGSGYICQVSGEDDREMNILQVALSLYPVYQNTIGLGGMPMHAGLIERDGNGVLLAAQGNTGKSTCCRRVPDPWRALCDDEALVVMGSQKDYRVHPFPTWSEYYWKVSEKSWNIRQHVSLSSIMFLEQAKTDSIVPLGPGKAALSIYNASLQCCSRFMQLSGEKTALQKSRLFQNACDMAKKIPAYALRVSLTGRFWEEIESVPGIWASDIRGSGSRQVTEV